MSIKITGAGVGGENCWGGRGVNISKQAIIIGMVVYIKIETDIYH